MNKKEKLLGEILIEKGKINAGQLQEALEEQKRSKGFLGSILLRKGMIKEKDLAETLSEQFNIQFVDLDYKYIDWEVVKGFSPSLILDYKCFPFLKDADSVTVAITNPLDVWVLKKAEEATRGFKLKLAIVSEGDMKELIQRYKDYA